MAEEWGGYPKNLFLTGPPGAGKTTLIFRELRKRRCPLHGFVVRRRVQRGSVTGFIMTDLTGGRSEDAIVHRSFGGVVGWTGKTSTFDGLGVEAILSACRREPVVVMDELGKFELEARHFRRAALEALSGPCPVLGVLKDDANEFLDEVRETPGTSVVRIDGSENSRAGAVEIVSEWLSHFTSAGIRPVKQYDEPAGVTGTAGVSGPAGDRESPTVCQKPWGGAGDARQSGDAGQAGDAAEEGAVEQGETECGPRWGRLNASLYSRAVDEEEYPSAMLPVILPNLRPDDIVLEIECGVGPFARYLAPHVRQIIGMDKSREALHELRSSASRRGLTNIVTLNSEWTEFCRRRDPGSFDVVIASYTGPEVVGGPRQILELQRLSRRLVFLVVPARAVRDDFDSDCLRQLLNLPPKIRNTSAGAVERTLKELGISYIAVDVVYRFGQRFANLEGCMEFVRGPRELSPHGRKILESFVRRKATRTPQGGVYLPNFRRSRLIWWRVG